MELVIKPEDLIAKFQYAINNKWGYIWGTAGITWTVARQKAATRDMTVKYGSKWIGHTVADCSGLFKWAFRQLGGDIYHGSNTIYRSYCSAKGKLSKGLRTDGIELKPGTAVFTGTEDSHGHIGLFVGNGKVIEAKGTQYGVVTSNVSDKKWTFWGELRDVAYGGDHVSTTKPTLKRGSKGDYVKTLQTKLAELGYDLGSYGIDGNFGKCTESAVKAFQRDHDLTADGIVGENTWRVLEDRKPTQLYTVTIPHLALETANALLSQYADAIKTEEGR